MDPRMEEVLQLTRDTNRMVHKMRRSMLWGRFFSVALWFIVVFGPVIAYYLYFQSYVKPYVSQIQQFSAQLQTANKQTQSYQTEISSFFGNLLNQASSTSSSTPLK